MQKVIKLVLIFAFMFSFESFAGEWVTNETGTWYKTDSNGYLEEGWHWIENKCYYINKLGYVLKNTKTPDGKRVDETGAWIKDGAVQLKQEKLSIGTLTTKVPDDYTASIIENGKSILLDDGIDKIQMRIVNSDNIDIIRKNSGDEGLEKASDDLVLRSLQRGTLNVSLMDKDIKLLDNQVWYHYIHNVVANTGDTLVCETYTNYQDSEIRLIFLMSGTAKGFSSNDEFISYCIEN